MPSEKKNPLIGAFREPAQEPSPPAEPPKGTAPAPVVETAPAKAGEVKKPIEPPKAAEVKAAPPAPEKPGEVKKPAEPPKAPEVKAAPPAPEKPSEAKKPTEPPKAVEDKGKKPEPAKVEEGKKPNPAKADEGKKPEPAKGDEKKPVEAVKSPNLRFVSLSKIVPLPGTYVKDEPREDYSELIASIKKNGMEKDFTLPITKAGQSEIITTLKVADIRPFEGHPFNVRDDKDMWDLVDSVKKFQECTAHPALMPQRHQGGRVLGLEEQISEKCQTGRGRYHHPRPDLVQAA